MCLRSGRALSCTGVAGLCGKRRRRRAWGSLLGAQNLVTTLCLFSPLVLGGPDVRPASQLGPKARRSRSDTSQAQRKGARSLGCGLRACQFSPCWRTESHITADTHGALPESALDIQPQSSQFQGIAYPVTTPISRPGLPGLGSLIHSYATSANTQAFLRVPQSRNKKGPAWGFRDDHAEGLLFSDPLCCFRDRTARSQTPLSETCPGTCGT